jgi:hypothetical protein
MRGNMTPIDYVCLYAGGVAYVALAAEWMFFLLKKFPHDRWAPIIIWIVTFFMPSIIFVLANIEATRK